MKTTNEQLEAAISSLTGTDEVSNFKKSLTEFYEEWLASEAASDRHIRGTMISHFNAMMNLLTVVEATREVAVS